MSLISIAMLVSLAGFTILFFVILFRGREPRVTSITRTRAKARAIPHKPERPEAEK